VVSWGFAGAGDGGAAPDVTGAVGHRPPPSPGRFAGLVAGLRNHRSRTRILIRQKRVTHQAPRPDVLV